MPNRGGEQSRFLHSLRRSRAAAFRSEIVPYFRYVFQSGFGLVVSAALFTCVIGYVKLLHQVPPSYPIGIAGTLAIAIAAVWTPLRTYMRPADPVFLLAMEPAVIRDYIRPARMAGLLAGILRTLAVYLLFVPLYRTAPITEAAASGRSLWLLGVCFAALAPWNAYGAWRERQIAYPSGRLILRAFRFIVTFVSVGALLLGPLVPALTVSLLSVAVVTLCWKLPQRHALPWTQLIAEEESVQRRWNRFLSWFVDLPATESRPARRRWAAWIADRLPWKRASAWQFLYGKTFSRGDTLGAFLRWNAVIAFIVLIAAGHPLAIWLAFGIGFFVGGVQLTELGAHKWALSVHTLPIDPELRTAAAAGTARAAGTAVTSVLWAAAAFSQGWPLTWISVAALAAGLLWHGWLIPRRIAKSRDEDDE